MIKSRYIISGGVNGYELPRAMALNGTDSFAARVLSPLDAARMALERSHVAMPELLSMYGQRALTLEAMNDAEYFDRTVECARNVCGGLNMLRGLIVADSVDKERETVEQVLCTDGAEGIFNRKNRDLNSIYGRYMTVCEQKDVADAITLLRLALKQAHGIEGEWIELEEFPLTPLEHELAMKLSGNTLKTLSISELFPANGEKGTELRLGEMTRGYGDTNECENVLSVIAARKLPLDSVVIAVTDPARYAQIFYDLSVQLGLPITFGCGIPCGATPAAMLLGMLREWYIRPCAITLENMTGAECFDRAKLIDAMELPAGVRAAEVIARAGALRLGMDAAENDKRISAALAADREAADGFWDCVKRLAAELQGGWEHIISRYSVVRTALPRQRVIDAAARDMLCTALRELSAYESTREHIAETALELLGRNVAASCCAEGALHVTTLEGAMGCARKHIFVCGLSASAFPGKVQENAVVLDEDIRRCARMTGQDNERYAGLLPLSENKVRLRAARLEQLVRLYCRLGDTPRCSYSGYELTMHKEENPSAALFRLWSGANGGGDYDGFVRSFADAGFFSTAVSKLYGDACSNARIAADEPQAEDGTEDAPEVSIPVDIDKISLSASAYATWYGCPRKYMLKYILRLPAEEKRDEWLPANDYGTLIHKIIERMALENIGKDEKERFMKLTEKVFTEYCTLNPPPYDVGGRWEDFRTTAENAFDSDPGNVVLIDRSETKIEEKHPCGIRLQGRPDRVEKDANGYILVDYKSGKRIKHVANDPVSCFQALMYMWLLRSQGVNASEAQFRYPAANSVVRCEWNDDMEAELNARLEEFVAAVRGGIFPEGTDEHNNGYSPCTYCEYKQFGFCGRK